MFVKFFCGVAVFKTPHVPLLMTDEYFWKFAPSIPHRASPNIIDSVNIIEFFHETRDSISWNPGPSESSMSKGKYLIICSLTPVPSLYIHNISLFWSSQYHQDTNMTRTLSKFFTYLLHNVIAVLRFSLLAGERVQH